MKRPYIICQMITSIDGKVTGDYLKKDNIYHFSEAFANKFAEYQPDAFAAGRVSLAGNYAANPPIDLTPFGGTDIRHDDFIANDHAGFYLVAIDAKGKLNWNTNTTNSDLGDVFGNAHIVTVLTESVDSAYLAYLRSISVSYIFAGTDTPNFNIAVEKLYKYFGIRKMIVEGGSITNGSFAYEGLIDELSIIMVPVTEDLGDNSTLFKKSPSLSGNIPPMICSFEKMEQLKENIIWLNYKRKKLFKKNDLHEN